MANPVHNATSSSGVYVLILQFLIVVETRRKDTECEKVAQDHCGKHCLCIEVAQSVAHWTSNVCNRRFNSGRCGVTHDTSCSHTYESLFTKQYILVPVKRRRVRRSVAGKVTAGLAESNGSQLLGL